MIFNFSIDSGAIISQTEDEAITISNHHRLIEEFTKLGQLIYPGSDFKISSLASQLKLLPISVRKRWEEALKVMRNRSGPSDWKGLEEASCPEELIPLEGYIDIAMLCPEKSAYFGVIHPNSSAVLSNSKIEICRFDCADRSITLTKSRELSESVIPAGMNVTRLWDERFKRLSESSKNLVIVDRYAVAHVLGRRDGYDGLRKIFTEINSSKTRNLNVKIFSAIPDSGFTQLEAEKAVEALVKCSDKTKLREVTLVLANDHKFKEISHGRYLRFDNTVCIIDIGIEVFSGKTVWRSSDFSTKFRATDWREKESKLLACNKSKNTWQVE